MNGCSLPVFRNCSNGSFGFSFVIASATICSFLHRANSSIVRSDIFSLDALISISRRFLVWSDEHVLRLKSVSESIMTANGISWSIVLLMSSFTILASSTPAAKEIVSAASALQEIRLDFVLDHAISFAALAWSLRNRFQQIWDDDSMLFAKEASVYENRCSLVRSIGRNFIFRMALSFAFVMILFISLITSFLYLISVICARILTGAVSSGRV